MPYVMVNAGSNPTREKHSFQNDFKISDSVKNFFRRSPGDVEPQLSPVSTLRFVL